MGLGIRVYELHHDGWARYDGARPRGRVGDSVLYHDRQADQAIGRIDWGADQNEGLKGTLVGKTVCTACTAWKGTAGRGAHLPVAAVDGFLRIARVLELDKAVALRPASVSVYHHLRQPARALQPRCQPVPAVGSRQGGRQGGWLAAARGAQQAVWGKHCCSADEAVQLDV